MKLIFYIFRTQILIIIMKRFASNKLTNNYATAYHIDRYIFQGVALIFIYIDSTDSISPQLTLKKDANWHPLWPELSGREPLICKRKEAIIANNDVVQQGNVQQRCSFFQPFGYCFILCRW